jgi:DNA-binding ferritin-like protein
MLAHQRRSGTPGITIYATAIRATIAQAADAEDAATTNVSTNISRRTEKRPLLLDTPLHR